MASDYAIGMICHVSSKANAAGSIQHWKWSMPRGWSVEEHDCDYASSDNWQLDGKEDGEEMQTMGQSSVWLLHLIKYFGMPKHREYGLWRWQNSTSNLRSYKPTTLQLHRLIPPSWAPFQLINASIHKSHQHRSKSKSSNKTVNLENGLK